MEQINYSAHFHKSQQILSKISYKQYIFCSTITKIADTFSSLCDDFKKNKLQILE